MAILLKRMGGIIQKISSFSFRFIFQPLNLEVSLEITARHHFDRLNTLSYILGDKNDVSILWILRLNRKGKTIERCLVKETRTTWKRGPCEIYTV